MRPEDTDDASDNPPSPATSLADDYLPALPAWRPPAAARAERPAMGAPAAGAPLISARGWVSAARLAEPARSARLFLLSARSETRCHVFTEVPHLMGRPHRLRLAVQRHPPRGLPGQPPPWFRGRRQVRGPQRDDTCIDHAGFDRSHSCTFEVGFPDDPLGDAARPAQGLRRLRSMSERRE